MSKSKTLSKVADKIPGYDSHLSNAENPHNTTANQTDAYTKKEVDDLLQGLEPGPGPGPSDVKFADITGDPLGNPSLETLFGGKQDINQGFQNRTTNFTIQISEHRVDRSTGNNNITVSLGNSNKPIYYWRVFRQDGSGVISINQSGVTINGSTQTSGPDTAILLHKIGANEWDSYGG